MDGTPAVAPPVDFERRAVWLAVAAGLVLVLRSSNNGLVFGLSGGHADAQLWLFMVSVGALGGSVLLAGLVALPELVGHPARIAARWNPVRLFGWAFALSSSGCS